MCNFDSHTQHVHLKLPSHALEVMDIPRPILITCKERQQNFEISMGSEEIIEQGLKFAIPAYESFVFELDY